MRSRLAICSITLLTAVVAGCASSSAAESDANGYFAAPMGEFASDAATPRRLVTSPAIELRWIDAEGGQWHGRAQIVCETEPQHEALAMLCLFANWQQAAEQCQLLATQNAPESAECVEQWELRLAAELQQTLFPPAAGEGFARVRDLRWQTLHKQRRGHFFDYQPLLRRN